MDIITSRTILIVYTLIYTCCLGLLCLVVEILNLRKLLVPMIVAGLAAIFYVNFQDWQHAGPVVVYGIDMSHMMLVDHFSVAFNAILIFASALIFVLSINRCVSFPLKYFLMICNPISLMTNTDSVQKK